MTIEREISQLNDLRHALLALHKTLLDRQRLWYEREHGRIENGGPLLQLLAYDPQFAWLRVLSAFIVEMDERLEDKEAPITLEGTRMILDEARGLFTGKEGGEAFQQNYNRALQESPDAVIAQAKVARLLGR